MFCNRSIFHSWGMWSMHEAHEIEVSAGLAYQTHRTAPRIVGTQWTQKRACSVCGLVQFKKNKIIV
jgi:hypothetical protein